ncbi:MAG TPA: hypothetical protein DDW21_02825 [Verrucomicrobiales bacterium]|nr:MAG: hypothetical protein B9S37_06525 [Verrucomicrobiae bacterium Tous-C3TDCM]PAZ06329.1 MAG: hypothetical protein CAK88_05365 [Verrucomicrobiae bacterium AMD-G2]HBE22387.1 hypothetical protein [Verrucomicrobiales bacterium]
MSSLTATDRKLLESLFDMSGGYVLDFGNRTFEEFVSKSVELDIHESRFSILGTSKANKLRVLWKLEPDHIVGKLLSDLIAHVGTIRTRSDEADVAKIQKCKEIASRLLAGGPLLNPLKRHADHLDAKYLAEQVRRMEAAIETDPSLAIGTAKELIETCCKTILAERGVTISGTPDVPTLTKTTLKELNLVPDGIDESTRGADVIKRLLSNLGTIGNGLAELRGLYGTGHGKHGNASGLTARHAKLAVGAAATLATFLFETHEQTKK